MNVTDQKPSYIVGIGGSAGGLEAFEEMLSHLAVDTGMAFVIVQHLDPSRKGMLPELLQRVTQMPVMQIEDGMRAAPNHVYVIPPNKDITILHGVLGLLDPIAPRGLRMPIDAFFRQLAEDQMENAIGIILSGMGTDGSLGVKAIKERMGMVMVQDPENAKFDGMPKSAITTGLIDFVLRVGEIPGKLVDYTKHIATGKRISSTLTEKTTNSLQKIFVLLRSRTGQDFSLYKKDTIMRRIKRRMSVHMIDSITDYVRYLQESPQEAELLFRELLIGVTKFFRDTPAFEALKEQITARLLRGTEGTNVFRAWIVGCSTGEEAYSVAIVLKEALDALEYGGGMDIQIFATDIDKEAIEVARRGCYDANIAVDVSPERLQRFFVPENDKFRLKKEIREMLVFAPHNTIMDPPFTRMHLVCCRNLLIYFSPELQQKVLPLLHYSLVPGGILFLGTSETVGASSDLFSTLDNKWKVFQSRQVERKPGAIEIPASRPIARHSPELDQGAGRKPSIQETAERALLQAYTPPAVTINENGDILYISGRTGKYLEISPGKANMNVYAMAREGLRHELGIAIRKAGAEKTTVSHRGMKVTTDGDVHTVDLTVRPIGDSGSAVNLLLVVFEDVKEPPRRRRAKVSTTDDQKSAVETELEAELRDTQDRLQDTIEEMQGSHEELQSTNEELQSANEELQSTNEELTTSREEMQSLNEELATVNAELQSKVDQLSHTNNDLRNLLNSTEIATIFLDSALNIRRFTAEATSIVKLIDSDVGRPITDLVSNLRYDSLVVDARRVLVTLIYKEMQVQTAEGTWHNMRIMPYRTVDNVIDGVVLTFSDITDLKKLEQCLTDERNLAEGIVATVREPLLVLTGDLAVVSASRSFYETFRLNEKNVEGRKLEELGKGELNIHALTERLEAVLPDDVEFTDFEAELDFPGVGPRKAMLSARRVKREASATPMILLAIEQGAVGGGDTPGPNATNVRP